MTVDELNDNFGIAGVLTFDEHEGMARAQVRMAVAEATVYLHGAHVTHWKPAGQEDVLYLAERSEFAAGKAIRGGVPICFPWFGTRADGSSGPSHGFARLEEWTLAFAALIPGELGDRLHLTFTLGPSEESRALGFDRFRVAYEVIVGEQLTLRLTVANGGGAALRFEEALHCYFAVGDVRETALTGLELALFRDKTDGMREKTGPAEALRFAGETDRVYPANTAEMTMHDQRNHRAITVEKAGSATTVVWNPGMEVAAKLADLGAEGWQGFLCVETANVATDAITLVPGASHTMQVTVSVAAC